jgi:hypothetical protein
VVQLSLTNYDSSKFPTIRESIRHSKNNKLVLSNISPTISIDDGFLGKGSPIFKKYDEYLKGFLTEIELTPNFRYSPRHVSKAYYGTPDLWYLVLWANNMTSKFELVLDKIFVFDKDYIKILNKIIELEKKQIMLSKKKPISINDVV